MFYQKSMHARPKEWRQNNFHTNVFVTYRQRFWGFSTSFHGKRFSINAQTFQFLQKPLFLKFVCLILTVICLILESNFEALQNKMELIN